MTELVRLEGIFKNFGGIRALSGVSLHIDAGEVVALLGHNGAGKSVLVQILSGVFPPSEGEILSRGTPVNFKSPVDARAVNFETIYQTLALAENLDAAANFFLGRELRKTFGFLDNKNMAKIAAREIRKLNPNFETTSVPVRNLSGGQRQAIAIARAVYFNAKLLIMDEPTAALGPHETAQVVTMIGHLRSEGLGILLVSHDLRDVFALADRVLVLKNGQAVGSGRVSNLTQDEVLEMMVAGVPESNSASTTERSGGDA